MRHFTRDRSPFRVRLACVKHAASVQSEPESNSPVQICSKDLRWTEIRISKFLPVRYSLVNEPHRFTRREAVVYAASFSLSTSFFSFRESFFSRPRRGNSLARGKLMSHFQTRVKNFFAIRENFFSRRPFGRGQFVGANGFMRLFDPTVKHFSAKKFAVLSYADWLFNQHPEKTQKNVRIFFRRHAVPLPKGCMHAGVDSPAAPPATAPQAIRTVAKCWNCALTGPHPHFSPPMAVPFFRTSPFPRQRASTRPVSGSSPQA